MLSRPASPPGRSYPGWTDAIGYLNGVQAAADAIPKSVTTWTLIDGYIEAIGNLNGVQSAAEAIPESVTTWTLVDGWVEAIGQLNAVQSAAEAIPTSITVSVEAIGGYAAGYGLGQSVLSGWDAATRTASPSGEMEDRGRYLFQGLERGWSHESETLPISFNTGVSAGVSMVGSGGGGGVVIEKGAVVNHIEVHGDDVDEERIAELAGQRTMEAMLNVVNDQRRGKGLQA